jgi:orotidine-5'-phosphate decarboxylase
MALMPKDRIIVALDVSSVSEALALAIALNPHVGGFKIGLELMTSMLAQILSAKSESEALALLRELHMLFTTLYGKIFWDGKLHDIPHTVGGASRALAALSVKMFTVHASAGKKALQAAVAGRGTALVLAATVLTSHSWDECESIFGASDTEKVLQFAHDARIAGCDGIVCSPKELSLFVTPERRHVFRGLLKVTPGIRARDAPPDDQQRTMTAAEAVGAGADYLVIGRPITQADKPVAAAKQFVAEVAEVV